MDTNNAKALILKAGIELVKKGLVAGTWGNISCRIDDKLFAITPSGRSYETLAIDGIVVVNIENCSYKGHIKPSSEKGIHAGIYRLFPDTNFIIHTHQEYASAISASALDSVILDEYNPNFGYQIPISEYALSGTDDLRDNVIKTFNKSNSKAVIMKNHGAICLGKTCDEAFRVADELEKICYDYIINKYFKLSRKSHLKIGEMIEFSLSINYGPHKISDYNKKVIYVNSERIEKGFIVYDKNKAYEEISFDSINPSYPPEVKTYNEIYKRNESINNIMILSTPEIESICRYNIELKPVLDDFAQIAGKGAKNVPFSPKEIVKALDNSFVVFINNVGALCCGRNKEETIAAAHITQKNSKAFIAASLFGEVAFINPSKCLLMRHNYLNSYSKQNHLNK